MPQEEDDALSRRVAGELRVRPDDPPEVRQALLEAAKQSYRSFFIDGLERIRPSERR